MPFENNNIKKRTMPLYDLVYSDKHFLTLKLEKELEYNYDSYLVGEYTTNECIRETLGFAIEGLNIGLYANERAYCVAFGEDGSIMGGYLISLGKNDCTEMIHENLFKFLIVLGAAKFCIFHNHPGVHAYDLSEADKRVAEKTNHIGELLGIEMVDSLVIDAVGGWNGYKSNIIYDDCPY